MKPFKVMYHTNHSNTHTYTQHTHTHTHTHKDKNKGKKLEVQYQTLLLLGFYLATIVTLLYSLSVKYLISNVRLIS